MTKLVLIRLEIQSMNILHLKRNICRLVNYAAEYFQIPKSMSLSGRNLSVTGFKTDENSWKKVISEIMMQLWI